MSNECTHYWDKADNLTVTKSTETEMEWTEKKYCDKCLHVKLTFMKGDKDKDGVVQNIHVVSEKIRPQTEVEKEQSMIRLS
jgi:hypothetical protein